MTWNELAKRIAAMPAEQRETDLAVYLTGSGEVIGTPSVTFFDKWDGLSEETLNNVDGTLDDNHPFLEVDSLNETMYS